MTFYILDHGPASRDRYGIHHGPSFGITLGGNTKVLATRPTQRGGIGHAGAATAAGTGEDDVIRLLPKPEDGRRLHTCSMCGRTDTWGDTWEWYGSMREWDDGKPLIKVCSVKCKQDHQGEIRNQEKERGR